MVASEVQRLTPHACAQLHALNCVLQKAVLRLDSVLVVCCGLLAKWLRVRFKNNLWLGMGPGNVLAVLFFFFLLVYKCGEHLCLCWLGVLSLFTVCMSQLCYSELACRLVAHYK